jgi:hypothetical protein
MPNFFGSLTLKIAKITIFDFQNLNPVLFNLNSKIVLNKTLALIFSELLPVAGTLKETIIPRTPCIC